MNLLYSSLHKIFSYIIKNSLVLIFASDISCMHFESTVGYWVAFLLYSPPPLFFFFFFWPTMSLPSVLLPFFPPLYPRLQHRPLLNPVRQDKPFLPGSISETLSVREKVSNSPCLAISVMGEDILIHLQYSSGDISSVMPNSNGQELIWTFYLAQSCKQFHSRSQQWTGVL